MKHSIFFFLLIGFTFLGCNKSSTPNEIDFEDTTTYDLPDSPEYGKCYAKCELPDTRILDWVEIICQVQMNEEVIKDIQRALTDLGYIGGFIDGKFDDNWKDTLKLFQRRKDLPVGYFNIPTMEYLGIEW